MRTGTAYFVSRTAANRYYLRQHLAPEDVGRKIKDGEIHVGKPPLIPGQTLAIIDQGTRYAVDED